MKFNLRLLALGAILPFLMFSTSCEKIKDEIENAAEFDATVDLPAEVVTIDSSSYKSSDNLLEWQILKQYTVAVDLQKILDDNDVDNAEFKNGHMDTYEGTLIFPDGVDFSSFTNQMKVTAALKEDFSDEVDVAQTVKIDPGMQTVVFDVYDVDITAFINASQFYLRVWSFKTNDLPVPMVNIELKGKVKITVKPLL